MQAGFAKVCVNPPLGTAMEGLGQRGPATKIRDDLFLRALYLSDQGQEALIIGCDLLFFERGDVDRFKGALGRVLPLAPSQVLFNVSHNHAGPRLTRWAYGGQIDPLYLEQIEAALLQAATQARANLQPVEIRAGATTTSVPVSRRKIDASGQAQWAPTKIGPICPALPVCQFITRDGKTLALLFCVSCHPSMWYELEISADYPGVAQRLLNEHFATEGAMFLQGAGGDSKPRQVADGETRWIHGTAAKVEEAGKEVADAVIACVRGGLKPAAGEIRCHYQDMHWPLAKAPGADELRAVRDDTTQPSKMHHWAVDMLARLERFGSLPAYVPVGLHAVQIARGVRLVALEGESVAELGLTTLASYNQGVTFPLGYSNGTQLYLPVSRMHREHGYEVDSFHEYHWPAPLLEGEEQLLSAALSGLQQKGIIPNGPLA